MTDVDLLRVAIGTVLSEDDELGVLASGGVHYRLVEDRDAAPPFCIFHMQAGSEQWAMGTSALLRDVWVVKGAAPTAGEAEAVDVRVRSLLTDAALVAAGAPVAFCRRIAPVEYSETDQGNTTKYRGSQFRITTDQE